MAAHLLSAELTKEEETTEQEIIHLKCKYCGEIYKFSPPDEIPHHEHPNGCPNPLPLACYNCFTPATDRTLFSNSQLANMDEGLPARCKECVQCCERTKRYPTPPPDPLSIDEQLTIAVANADEPVDKVRELLAQGANPNYVRRRYVRDHNFGLSLAYHADGSSMPEIDEECFQPTTPLKLVGFRISDCMLTEADLWRFKEVADVLIEYRADAKPALKIMENRYGKWEENEEEKEQQQGEEHVDNDEGRKGVQVAFCAVFATVFRAATAATNSEL